MSDSSSILDCYQTTIDWLLEPSNPSVRYWALQQILHHSSEEKLVQESHKDIQKSKPVLELLHHQQQDGSWRGARGDLWDEKGTVFSLLLLGELGVSGDRNTERALDNLHSRYQMSNGRLAYRRVDTPRRRESDSTWMWCVTAVALRAALLLGHLDHPFVTSAITFFQEYHEDQGGWYCSTYSKNPAKVRPPNCYMGSIKALNAFSLLPKSKQTKRIRSIIKQEVDICLENRICFYRVGRKGEPVLKRAWMKFSFPRYWRSDTLEAVDVITNLVITDERLKDSIDIIMAKETEKQRWNLDYSEAKRSWIEIESEGLPSKWVTLRALRILQRIWKMCI